MERENRDLIGGMGVARLEHELVQIKTILRGLSESRAASAPLGDPDASGTVTVQVPQPLQVTVDDVIRIHQSELEPILVRLQNAPPRRLDAWLTASVEEPTFVVYYDRIAPAAGKQLATLWNAADSTRVRIWRIALHNFQETAVTGAAIFGELRRITAHSGGTVLAPLALDTDHGLPAGIVASTGATVTTAALLARWVASSEEVDPTATALQALLSVCGTVIYEHRPPQTPLTLRKNQGITLVQSTNTTVGSVSATIVFSVIG